MQPSTSPLEENNKRQARVSIGTVTVSIT